MYVGSFVRFNTSETSGCAIVKLGAIDQCLGVNVIRGS